MHIILLVTQVTRLFELFRYLLIYTIETNELLYLDPHVTQQHVDTTVTPDDITYHCDKINRMKFSALDPSLALVKFCLFFRSF